MSPEHEVLEWLNRISDDLHAKLAAVGLVRARGSMLLADFVDSFIDGCRKFNALQFGLHLLQFSF